MEGTELAERWLRKVSGKEAIDLSIEKETC